MKILKVVATFASYQKSASRFALYLLVGCCGEEVHETPSTMVPVHRVSHFLVLYFIHVHADQVDQAAYVTTKLVIINEIDSHL